MTEDVESAAHGAVLTFCGMLFAQGCAALVAYVLADELGVVLYGLFEFGRRLVGMALAFGTFGSGNALVRYLPSSDQERRRRLLGLATATTAVASVAIGAALFVGADLLNRHTVQHPQFPALLRAFALLLPARSVLALVAGAFRALEDAGTQALLTRVVRPAVELLAFAGAVWLWHDPLAVVLAGAVATAAVALGGAGLFVRRTAIAPTLAGAGVDARAFLAHAVPEALSRVGHLFQSRIDVVLVGLVLGSTAVSAYSVALTLVFVVGIPLFAFNQLLPAIAARHHADGATDRLNAVYRRCTRLTLTLTIPLALPMALYRTELLALFGPEFTRGSTVLLAFVCGRLVGNAVGATGWLLSMTDHQYLQLANDWAVAVVNLVGSYLLVTHVGLVGAALATAGSVAVSNLVRLAQLYWLEDVWPYDRTFTAPLLAGTAMALALLGTSRLLSGTALLVGGTTLGLLVYARSLSLAGVPRQDRRLARRLAGRYRTRVAAILARARRS
ncbi:oligosaccharide flippase family protein [Halomarina rubra]|uniref:Oligosaccharide flippase family protein n=1 Tax=Halomarina rubra TaxID=2071873 RepID=A0ABD6AVF7_9EURY